MKKLVEKMNLTLLVVSHDIQMIQLFCNRIGVMYNGRFVELVPSDKLNQQNHPYTQMLFNPDTKFENIANLINENQSSPNGHGCVFYHKCFLRNQDMILCNKQRPELTKIDNDHWVACHYMNERMSY